MNGYVKRFRSAIEEPRERFGLLLALLVATFVMSGLDTGPVVHFTAGLTNLLSLLVALTCIGLRRLSVRWLLIVGVGVAGSALVFASQPEEVVAAVGGSAQAVVLAAVAVAVLRRILGHETVTNQTLLGAISVYFLFGQIFAWVYFALPGFAGVSVLDPAQVGEIPMYYSYVVLTTLGFGDITPVGGLSQRITVIEALLGQLFLAILVARLVAVYSRASTRAG